VHVAILGFTRSRPGRIVTDHARGNGHKGQRLKEAAMKRAIRTAAIILGLGGATMMALANHGPDSKPRPAPVTTALAPAPERAKAERAALQARVARLRAEAELLQLEHDAIRAALASLWETLSNEQAELLVQSGRDELLAHYARLGAEMVGKAAEFDKEIQKNAAAKEALKGTPGIPTELQREREHFLEIATKMHEKKLELIELEKRLDGAY
jgi:hypothetical protein